MNFDMSGEVLKPVFDGSVSSLQDCLKYEGLFPANVDSTGVFGNVTKNALIAFQKRYNIVPSYGNFGPITKAKLAEIYS
jgi:peptidoglycan hydrolase-like protein with peptidoglycan-binding domain